MKKRSVFRLILHNGEFQIIPFQHNPEKDILTPEGYRRKKGKKK